MRKWLFIVAVLAALSVVPPLRADDKAQVEGTSSEEIAKLKKRPLPPPSKIKVAVLPFWDVAASVEHVRIGAAANWLLWKREGFQMIPILKGFQAFQSDTKMEPGAPPRREDAVRIGKALGADWVVYGELRELTVFKKRSFFKNSKYITVALRVSVASVKNDDLLYWQIRRDKKGGTGFQQGFQSKMVQLKRRATALVSYDATKQFFDALPEHKVTGDVPESGELAKFIGDTWPDEKNKEEKEEKVEKKDKKDKKDSDDD